MIPEASIRFPFVCTRQSQPRKVVSTLQPLVFLRPGKAGFRWSFTPDKQGEGGFRKPGVRNQSRLTPCRADAHVPARVTTWPPLCPAGSDQWKTAERKLFNKGIAIYKKDFFLVQKLVSRGE